MQLKPSGSLNKPSRFNGCDICSVYMLSIRALFPSYLPSNPLYDYAFFPPWSFIVVIWKDWLVIVHRGIHNFFSFLKIIFLKYLSIFCNDGIQIEFSYYSWHRLNGISSVFFRKENWYVVWCDLILYSWELPCSSIIVLLPILFHYFIKGCLIIEKLNILKSKNYTSMCFLVNFVGFLLTLKFKILFKISDFLLFLLYLLKSLILLNSLQHFSFLSGERGLDRCICRIQYSAESLNIWSSCQNFGFFSGFMAVRKVWKLTVWGQCIDIA